MNSCHIPANFTDSGRLFGLFPIRSTIEAVLLTVPLFFMLFSYPPFPLTANIIVTMIIVVPVGGFAMIGINGDSLIRFMPTWLRFRERRRILTYREETALTLKDFILGWSAPADDGAAQSG